MTKFRFLINYCLFFAVLFLGQTNLFAGEEKTGSLADAVFTAVAHYSNKKKQDEPTSNLVGHWTEVEDAYGIVFISKDIKFRDFKKSVETIYGPAQNIGRSQNGRQQFVIPAARAGAAIWFSELNPGLRVAVNKPIRFAQ